MSHKENFNDAVTELIASGIEDRTQRMTAIEKLTSTYYDQTGECPDAYELERLTDYILREELTDMHPDKVTNTEYPFFSASQLALRLERETSEKAAEEYGADRKNYGEPTRRRRSRYEMWHVDHYAKGRNKQRAEQYARDTAPSPIITYNLNDTGGELTEEFTQCAGISDRLPEREQFVDADVQITA